MSLKKVGTPKKILSTAASDLEFEQLKNKIAKDNNLKRCTACSQLLAKFDSDNKIINVQKKNLDLIAEVQNVQVRCPKCQQVNFL